jgi:hypothetical protein
MLKGMTQHQANRHPVATGLIVMVFGPLVLAAMALYVVVFVAYVVLSAVAEVGYRAHQNRRQR